MCVCESITMRIALGDHTIPYPSNVLLGKLRMSGLSDAEAYNVLAKLKTQFAQSTNIPSIDRLSLFVQNMLSTYPKEVTRNFEILSEYEDLRKTSPDIPPLILILEGSSASGKSMLAIRMIANLSSTRIISTDTIRQILRTSFSKQDFPELFCHTYQAYQHKQVGPENLSDVVRGYLAQCEIIHPTVNELISRLSLEGVTAVIEGVHIIPGRIKELNPGVVEIIIHPRKDDHRAMFTSKHLVDGLTTVSSSEESRLVEFKATREIQEFMIDRARETNTHIVELAEYHVAEMKICEIVIEAIEDIMSRT